MKSASDNRQLDRKAAIIAAAASVLGVLIMGAAMIVLRQHVRDESLVTPLLISCAAALVLVLGAGFQLVTGQTIGQRALLAFWLCLVIPAVSLILVVLLWGLPQWLMFGETDMQYAGTYKTVTLISVAIVAVFATGLSVLLIRASKTKSRLRYSSLVIASIAAVVALVIAVNVTAQKEQYRASVETLGRYRASERTRKILSGVDVPLRMTCVYTATADKKTGRKSGAQYRQQVLELLRDMAYLNDRIEVVNVTSDEEKARITERLREKRNRRASKHMKLLENFRDGSKTIITELRNESKIWTSLADDSYIAQWNLPATVVHMLTNMSKRMEELQKKIITETNKPMIDFKSIVKIIKDPIEKHKQTLDGFSGTLAAMSELPAAVTKNKSAALASLDDCLRAIEDMVGSAGKESDGEPSDPTVVLKAYAAASDKAVKAIRLARKVLDGVGGPKFTQVLQSSKYWVVHRNYLTKWYQAIGGVLATQRLNVQTVIERMTGKTQAELVANLRRKMPKLLQAFKDADAAARKALGALATADKASGDLMEQAKKGDLFAGPKKILSKLLEQIEKLPKLGTDELPSEITGENIVIIETPDRAEAVSFESVWPLKVKPRGPENVGGEQKREFNGDSAIASAILHMTQKSFGTVYLTYFRPRVPPQMARTLPRADIEPGNLSVLRRRLEAANFNVEDWNLAVEDSPGASNEDKNGDKDDSPKVLLILPPPPPQMPNPYARQTPTPSFGPEHIDKIRREIDSGTPAIFPAYFVWPRQMSFFGPLTQPPYAMNGYLRSDWGIEVKSDFRAIQAVPDKTSPGLFRIDIQAFRYLPLSTFSDHPITLELQGQRVLWTDLCPVGTTKKLPAGVTVSPLLSVPSGRRNLWATRRIAELIRQVQSGEGSYVSPDFNAGDIAPPFDLAVAAVSTATRRKVMNEKGKTETRRIKPSRIVVLGVGMSLVDGYLNSGVSVIGPDGSITMTDKPAANADLVINSAYWLIGREKYIAAGPASGKPIAMIPPTTAIVLKIAYWIVLPGLIVGLGVLVALFRRRQ